jgi:SH3-like domain-containing protein
MRFTIRVLLALTWLFAPGGGAAGGGAARAQSLTPPGTLQVPTARPHDQPAKPPVAAPRQPVQKIGPAHGAATPVVPPRGPIHPHKPGAAPGDKSKPAAVIVPPPVAPTDVPPETKAVPSDKLPDPEKPEGAPAKLPRFASLRSDDVNMRAGPGTRYRIDWVYKRRELPVEIEREFDVWRWVRDSDGIQGWVHQATLMGRRSFVVQKSDATLRSDASDTASAVAVLKPGVIGRIRSCEALSDWCNVQTGSYRGFLRRQQFWGLLPGEAIAP